MKTNLPLREIWFCVLGIMLPCKNGMTLYPFHKLPLLEFPFCYNTHINNDFTSSYLSLHANPQRLYRGKRSLLRLPMPTVFFIEVLFGVHGPLTQSMSVCGDNVCGDPVVKAVVRPLITIQFRGHYNIFFLTVKCFRIKNKKIFKYFLRICLTVC